jgi:hypothetical protein
MHGAVEIDRGARAELAIDQSFVGGFAHARVSGWMVRHVDTTRDIPV